jgi:hypothetical protein
MLVLLAERHQLSTHGSIPRGRALMKSRKLLKPDDLSKRPPMELAFAFGQERIYRGITERIASLDSGDRRSRDSQAVGLRAMATGMK